MLPAVAEPWLYSMSESARQDRSWTFTVLNKDWLLEKNTVCKLERSSFCLNIEKRKFSTPRF